MACCGAKLCRVLENTQRKLVIGRTVDEVVWQTERFARGESREEMVSCTVKGRVVVEGVGIPWRILRFKVQVAIAMGHIPARSFGVDE